MVDREKIHMTLDYAINMKKSYGSSWEKKQIFLGNLKSVKNVEKSLRKEPSVKNVWVWKVAKDNMREMMESMIVKIYDSVIQAMDDMKTDSITRSQVMAMKLNFQQRMDLT